MFGLIVLALLIGLCVVFPPAAIIVIPFIIVALLSGWFFRSATKSITDPIGNDINSAGSQIAHAIEKQTALEYQQLYGDTTSNHPALAQYVEEHQAQIAEYIHKHEPSHEPPHEPQPPQVHKDLSTAEPPKTKKKRRIIPKKDDLIGDIEKFLEDEKGESNGNGT